MKKSAVRRITKLNTTWVAVHMRTPVKAAYLHHEHEEERAENPGGRVVPVRCTRLRCARVVVDVPVDGIRVIEVQDLLKQLCDRTFAFDLKEGLATRDQ